MRTKILLIILMVVLIPFCSSAQEWKSQFKKLNISKTSIKSTANDTLGLFNKNLFLELPLLFFSICYLEILQMIQINQKLVPDQHELSGQDGSPPVRYGLTSALLEVCREQIICM